MEVYVLLSLEECLLGINNTMVNKKSEVLRNQKNTNKPFGSFGMLETVGYKLSEIIGINQTNLKSQILVFAGDHGIADMKLSAFPQSQTKKVVGLLSQGNIPLNKMTEEFNISIKCYDIGINGELNYNDVVIRKKINNGTKNIYYEDAMTSEDAYRAIDIGINLAEQYHNDKFKILGVGEIGICNTISTSVITAILCELQEEDVTGSGTGVVGDQLIRKKTVIKDIINKNRCFKQEPITLLAKVGGYEICGVVGLLLGCSYLKIPVVIDGYISAAAALVAYNLCPSIKNYIFASHLSAEKGHKYIMKELGLNPIIDLGMRYGVATGVALALPIYKIAYKIVNA